MNIGMLWFDNDPKADLSLKIDRAANYYQSKYGKEPTLCFVHPSMLQQAQPKHNRIEVRTNRHVRPNHFWIGINGKDESGKSTNLGQPAA